MIPRLLQWGLSGVCLLASVGVDAAAAEMGRRCELPPLSSDSVIHAPRPAVGSAWTYSVGGDVPPSTLTLEKVDGGEALFKVEANGRAWPSLRERLDTYARVNPLRDGEQVLLRFPLQVGETWEDEFVEPGEIELGSGSFRYTYQEWAVSEVVAVEEITTALGSFPALRIERVARWLKSRPESDDMDHMRIDDVGEVDGLDRSVSWYVPAIDRVVLRKAQSMHPARAYHSRIDEKSAASLITELVAYSEPSGCVLEGAPVSAKLPGQAPSGYPFRDNDTWEYMLQTRPHRAQPVAEEP
ncbi:MAG: hypothetical protein ACTHZI_12335 [Luteimonas sp.]